MGAHEFMTVGYGKTKSEAYRGACWEAQAENGHQDGYSGDIQTTSGSWAIHPDTVKGLRRATRLRILELVAFGLKPSKGELYGRSLEAYNEVKGWAEAEKWGRCYAVQLRHREWAFAGIAAS